MNTATVHEYKKPPQNIEIESAILAGCILFRETRQDALLYVSEDDFYKRGHKQIYQAISEMSEAGTEIDLISLTDHLRNAGTLADIGGAYYLSQITEYPVPNDVKAYADKLKKYAQVRKIIEVCGTTMGKCYDQSMDNLDELINDFQRDALLAGQGLLAPWKPMNEIMLDALERYEDLNTGAAAKAVPTGYPRMDKLFGGGFRGSKLIIIAARPGVGKTALATNMIMRQASRGYCAGFFSLEMDQTEIVDRWVSADARVNTMRLCSEPGPDKHEWSRIARATDRQGMWPVFLDDTGGLKIGELKRRARQMVRAGAQIIFIDQLSKIGGKRNISRFDRNSEHVEELAFLKKELRIPIVLLAQLNRDLEKRDNKKPRLSDLKNTGQLEEDADIVLLGFRPALYDENADEGLAEWEIAKNRQGATYNVQMVWQPTFVRFDELEFSHNERSQQ